MHSSEGKSDGSAGGSGSESGGALTNGGTVCGVARHSREGPGMSGTNNECAGCGKRITDRFLLKALDMYWHEDCLKCGCCDCRLGEVGSTLYTKANLILCKRDYLRLFGNTGYCAACSKIIPAFEMVMRARNNVYHLECFACQQCNHRFCVGDRFYLCENKILCEYDYEERMVFANMAYSPGNIALLRRQVTHFQQSGIQNDQQQRHEQFSVSQTPVNEPYPHPPPSQQSRGPENIHVMKSPVGASRSSNFLVHPCPSKGAGCTNYRQVNTTNLDDGSSNGYGSPDSGIVEGP